jgi:hypothetical protein
VGLKTRSVQHRLIARQAAAGTWDRPFAPWSTSFTQSPAMKVLLSEVRCRGRHWLEPGLKWVTARGKRSTALSTTCARSAGEVNKYRLGDQKTENSYLLHFADWVGP